MLTAIKYRFTSPHLYLLTYHEYTVNQRKMKGSHICQVLHKSRRFYILLGISLEKLIEEIIKNGLNHNLRLQYLEVAYY